MENAETGGVDGTVVHPFLVFSPIPLIYFLLLQEAFFNQDIQIDKIWVSCCRRERLVRGVSIAGRAKRQNLPPALTG